MGKTNTRRSASPATKPKAAPKKTNLRQMHKSIALVQKAQITSAANPPSSQQSALSSGVKVPVDS